MCYSYLAFVKNVVQTLDFRVMVKVASLQSSRKCLGLKMQQKNSFVDPDFIFYFFSLVILDLWFV